MYVCTCLKTPKLSMFTHLLIWESRYIFPGGYIYIYGGPTLDTTEHPRPPPLSLATPHSQTWETPPTPQERTSPPATPPEDNSYPSTGETQARLPDPYDRNPASRPPGPHGQGNSRATSPASPQSTTLQPSHWAPTSGGGNCRAAEQPARVISARRDPESMSRVRPEAAHNERRHTNNAALPSFLFRSRARSAQW